MGHFGTTNIVWLSWSSYLHFHAQKIHEHSSKSPQSNLRFWKWMCEIAQMHELEETIVTCDYASILCARDLDDVLLPILFDCIDDRHGWWFGTPCRCDDNDSIVQLWSIGTSWDWKSWRLCSLLERRVGEVLGPKTRSVRAAVIFAQLMACENLRTTCRSWHRSPESSPDQS